MDPWVETSEHEATYSVSFEIEFTNDPNHINTGIFLFCNQETDDLTPEPQSPFEFSDTYTYTLNPADLLITLTFEVDWEWIEWSTHRDNVVYQYQLIEDLDASGTVNNGETIFDETEWHQNDAPTIGVQDEGGEHQWPVVFHLNEAGRYIFRARLVRHQSNWTFGGVENNASEWTGIVMIIHLVQGS
jgi:hypothetical protein